MSRWFFVAFRVAAALFAAAVAAWALGMAGAPRQARLAVAALVGAMVFSRRARVAARQGFAAVAGGRERPVERRLRVVK